MGDEDNGKATEKRATTTAIQRQYVKKCTGGKAAVKKNGYLSRGARFFTTGTISLSLQWTVRWTTETVVRERIVVSFDDNSISPSALQSTMIVVRRHVLLLGRELIAQSRSCSSGIRPRSFVPQIGRARIASSMLGQDVGALDVVTARVTRTSAATAREM
nr:hypothetical protein CFP56_46699 [Quercus suber]